MIGLAGLGQITSVKNAEETAQDDLKDQLKYISSRIEEILIEKQQYLQDEARMNSTIELYYSAVNSSRREDWEAIPEYMLWTKEFSASYDEEPDVVDNWLGFKGIDWVLASEWVQLPPGYKSNTRAWYTETVAANGFHITSPYVSANLEDQSIQVTLGYPIYARDIVENERGEPVDPSNIIGVTAINLDLSYLREILIELEQEFNVVIGLYDKAGPILYDGDYEAMVSQGIIKPDPESMMTFVDFIWGADESQPREEIEGLFELMKSGLGSFLTEFDGSRIVVAHKPLADGNWVLNISQPFALNGGVFIKEQLRRNIQTSAILFVILVISTFIINSLVIKNIVRSSKALEDISEGDADLTVSIEVHTRDEIGQLGIGFNNFVEKLRGWIVQIKDVINDTDSVSLQVTSSTEETTAAVEEASAILQSIGSEVDNLDSSLSQTVSAIEQINSNVMSMDSQISDQAAMVEESTAAITEMIASLGNVSTITKNKQQATEALSRVAVNGKTQIENTLDIFKQVVSNIGSIQEMADSINAIASQTNLLSMNAAIEAAHAGDAGKGFAVVAEEIRKLAETAGQSSTNITSLINSVTESVELTDESAKKTSEMFDEINKEVTDTVNAFSEIEQSITELNIGSKQVLQASEEISSVTNNIQAGSNEIKNGAESILNSSTAVRDVSQKVSRGMREVTTGNNEILSAMQIMVEHSKKLDSIVSKLKEQFGGFKTE